MSSVQTMAVESPFGHSPGHGILPFSPYSEYSASPNSPKPTKSPRFQHMSAHSSSGGSLYPTSSLGDALSPASANISSPNDIVGPSPVTSNGTETTEIDDNISEGISEGAHDDEEVPARAESQQTVRAWQDSSEMAADYVQLVRLSTNIPDSLRSAIDDESVSVIHAPQDFTKFTSRQITPPAHPNTEAGESTRPVSAPANVPSTSSSTKVNPISGRSTPTPYRPDGTDGAEPPASAGPTSAPAEEATKGPHSPPALSTNISSINSSLDSETPRAQTREEAEAEEIASIRSTMLSRGSSLEGIPEETQDAEHDVEANPAAATDEEIQALKTALHECWTLCNTLASLSSIHRERIFSSSGTGDAHEIAWKCCWKLCIKLYDDRDENHLDNVRPTLDLCRDFCQALFDVRQRKDEVADSVLRVSFELNNHLYNTHDRSLPEAFRERTLDFYITLCHRLMKQRNDLAEETDALLRACWGLAEMLFSLRQNKRDGKPADEELLGSAVQACWELCDLFREGWTQVRPERGTPRPSQTTFTQVSDQMSRSTHSKSRSLTSVSEKEHPQPKGPHNPETPTTEFDDTPVSPELSPNIPNILVLGSNDNRARWSSNASSSSSLSNYSKGSTGSTATITSPAPEDINLTRLKILILKAAMNVGFSRAPQSGGPATLQNFVKALATGSFGSLPNQATLLTAYRSLVLSDPAFRSGNSLPALGMKASAVDVAKSVKWMMRSGQYTFLKDLFRLVFGFQIEEAEGRKGVVISV